MGDSPSVAFIGIGQMGLPMALQLVAAGHRVLAIDPSPRAREEASAAGLEVSGSLSDAVAARTIVLMLPDSDVVDGVVAGLLAEAGERATELIIDMSSSEPVRTQSLAARVRAAGLGFVDAPVSGGVPRAKTGDLAIMVGGADDDVACAMGVLAPMGGSITHVGAAGAGHAVKALNNLLSATHLLASNEAALVASKFGIDPLTFIDVVNASSGRSGSTEVKLPRYVFTRSFDSGFRADLLAKDVRIAMDVVGSTGIEAPVAGRAAERWAELNDRLDRGDDHTAIVLPAERDAGVVLGGSPV